MDYLEHIQRAIDYMEANLCWEMNLSQCAQAAGYSPYHFSRIFREATGLTPADYIRKRRLTEIVTRFSQQRASFSELAFHFGFNSQENFIRAFQSEFHIRPTEFKNARNSLRLYPKISFSTEPFSLEPVFCELDSFELTVYPEPEEGFHPPDFWNQYNCRNWSKRLSGGSSCLDYGVSIWEPNGFRYYIGILSSQAQGDTTGAVRLTIPAGKYVVFETPESSYFDFVATIHKVWNWILFDYLPHCPHLRRDTPAFETYLEEKRTFREKIWIPFTERNDIT